LGTTRVGETMCKKRLSNPPLSNPTTPLKTKNIGILDEFGKKIEMGIINKMRKKHKIRKVTCGFGKN